MRAFGIRVLVPHADYYMGPGMSSLCIRKRACIEKVARALIVECLREEMHCVREGSEREGYGTG